MRIAIIEDEQFARQQLEDIIRKLRPEWQVAFRAESIEECVDYFAAAPEIDLIFMDTELVDGNCFEIFRQVDIATPVIFTTAYDEYAIQAFSTNSVHYLLKPITEGDVEKAIAKFESASKPAVPAEYHRLDESLNRRRSRIMTYSGDNYIPVDIDSISFFLSEDKYVYAYLKDGHRRLTEFLNLNDTMDALDRNRFFQISRNIITSIDAVKQVSKYFKGRLKVVVAAGEQQQEIIVSAARRQQTLDWLSGGS